MNVRRRARRPLTVTAGAVAAVAMLMANLGVASAAGAAPPGRAPSTAAVARTVVDCPETITWDGVDYDGVKLDSIDENGDHRTVTVTDVLSGDPVQLDVETLGSEVWFFLAGTSQPVPALFCLKASTENTGLQGPASHGDTGTVHAISHLYVYAAFATPPDPSIGILKEVSVDGGQSFVDANAAPFPELPSGTAPQYRITVTNTGNVPLVDTALTDVLDGSAYPLPGTCTLPDPFAVDEVSTCTFTPGSWPEVGQVLNTATAVGYHDGDEYDASDPATYTGTSGPDDTVDLAIEKTASEHQVSPGDEVTYTLRVTNLGTATASDVVVTDRLPAGTTYVGSSPGCSATGQIVTCTLGTMAAGTTRTVTITVRVAPLTGETGHSHQLDFTKTEAHLSLQPGDTGTLTATCPDGYLATDGSVRLDAVDQGTGTFADAVVLASGVTADGRGWTGTVRNDALGQVQGKVNVVCMSKTTTSGESHRHPVLVSQTTPPSTTYAVPAGRGELELTCPAGNIPIDPSFAFSAGEGIVTTRHTPAGWRFITHSESGGTATFSIRCLSIALGTTDGHSHDLAWNELVGSTTVPAGGVAEAQLTCDTGYKGIVAWVDYDGVPLGTDPQPITRVYRFYNPGGQPLTADYGLICVAVRTAGGDTWGDIVNTASVASAGTDANPSDNTDGATVSVSPYDVAGSAAVASAGNRVHVRVMAAARKWVRMSLLSVGHVRGTGIDKGDVLAGASTTLRTGRHVVVLKAAGRAATALHQGKITRAKLVVTTRDGTRTVRIVKIAS